MSCEPLSEAALTAEALFDAADAADEADALSDAAEAAEVVDAAEALVEADPIDDEHPANSVPPKSIVLVKPASFKASRLVYM